MHSIEASFKWLKLHGIKMYKCDWSPTSLAFYEGFLTRLDTNIRNAGADVLIIGDFNAKIS